MEAEVLDSMRRDTKEDDKARFFSRENDMNLIKRDSLISLRHPLRSSCARHGSINDFLPTEILANLTTQFETMEDLGPRSSAHLKNGKAFAKVHPRRPPDNVWNHAKTRDRFKHLTEQPPCTCGAGRDISFLYDAVSEKRVTGNSTSFKSTAESRRTNKDVEMSPNKSQECVDALHHNDGNVSSLTRKDGSQFPESLLPLEFHVVKNPGVIGLEIHEDKFTTTMNNHEKHRTLFPSMKPSGRQEAILLKKTMEDLLSRAGVDDLKQDEDQPTQIHALLDLIKQEQNIYNVIFNEVIRQVTIECVERGEILANLRKRYAGLLDKVPRHVKSLHEEVLAQRALDRRLTEELTRFKTSITLLTRELDSVQQHDREVTKQAAETQNELDEALKESEKNASLLAEYHELYELQRKRLEFQISKLIEERDLWAGSSYTLSLKVARKNNLKTAKRLHLHEKAWHKLADHFAIVLSDIDSIHLQKLTTTVQQWQELAEMFNEKLIANEKETHRKLCHLRKQIRYWGKQFVRVVTPDEGTVHPPEKQTIARLYDDMKRWEEVFNMEIERFSGDVLLSCEDDLLKMNAMVDSWNEVALKIFRRHPSEDPNGNREEHDLMMSLNKEIDKFHKNLKARMTGENGVAKGMIHFINVFDSLSNKLNGYSIDAEVILDPEWVRLADFLQNEWEELLAELIELVNHGIDSDPIFEQVDMHALSKHAQKWLTETTKAIENADASILDHVSYNHSNMVRWMVTALLRLTPDLEEDTFEDDGKSENVVGIGAAIISESVTGEIQERARLQFRRLRKLTDELHRCCAGIINDDVNETKETETAGIEAKDLKKLQVECNGWINTAKLLIEEISGDKLEESENEDEMEKEDHLKATESMNRKTTMAGDEKTMSSGDVTTKTGSPNGPNAENRDIGNESFDEEHPEEKSKADEKSEKKEVETMASQRMNESIKMHVIGHDKNVEMKMLDAASISLEMSNHDVIYQRSSIETLGTIEKLQKQLVETEERAQLMEKRAIVAEGSLKEALERIRALERSARRSSHDTSQRSASAVVTASEANSNEESLTATARVPSSTVSYGPPNKVEGQ